MKDDESVPKASPEPSLASRIRAVLNGSGFPFQIAVERHIERDRERHGWELLGRERPYAPSDGKGGFSDLLLRKDDYTLVVECKRHDADWIFLHGSGEQPTRRGSFRYARDAPERSTTGAFVADTTFGPEALESDICVVARMLQKGNGPLKYEEGEPFESICRPLVEATDAHGHAAGSFLFGVTSDWQIAHVPLIVTTARLYTASLDFDQISLADGHIGTALEVHPQRCVRFRKSLTARRPEGVLDEAQYEDRTVFVVQANAITWFLRELAELPFPSPEDWPAEAP